MSVTLEAAKTVEAMIRLIYPCICGGCAQTLDLEERYLCKTCRDQLIPLRYAWQEQCLNLSLKFIHTIWALYRYDSPLREVLTAVKFQRKRWLLQFFKDEIGQFVSTVSSEESFDRIVPIPLDRHRLMERQFNQAALLARLLGKKWNIPVTPVLRKRSGVTTQSSLNKKERLLNLWGAFYLKNKKLIQGQKILLVDDILTTGATLEEAARIMKESGAASVSVWALAYTPSLP